jgi:short chain dehydrogenase
LTLLTDLRELPFGQIRFVAPAETARRIRESGGIPVVIPGDLGDRDQREQVARSWSTTAARLALNGAHVIVTGRDTTRGDQAVERIRSAGGKADFVAASLSGEASACELARKAVELGGGHIDILVNNAGIFPFGPTASRTEADFDGVYGVNVKVPFFLVAELAPAMAARGRGSLVAEAVAADLS